MAGDSIKNLNITRLAVLQTACSICNFFSAYHRFILHISTFSVFLWLEVVTAVVPDTTDVVFLIAVQACIWWTNPFSGIVGQRDRARCVGILPMPVGFEIVLFAIVGYVVALIISFLVFIPTIFMVVPFLSTPAYLYATRISWMSGTCNGMYRFFGGIDKSEFRGIFRIGLALGASIFFMREHGFFSSDIYYTWKAIGVFLIGKESKP